MATASVQNSSSTVTTYLKAYHSCYRNMILLLPIDHFIIDLVEKDQLPGDLKSHIQAKETREMKVQCLLDNIEGGIKAGYSERFVKLIQAVKEYAVRERRHDLKKSAEDTLSQLPDAIGRDVGLQCDIMPMPVEPDVYSVMFVGNVGSGKSAAYNFFVQNKIFETGWGWMPFNRPSSHICVIAHKQVRLIDTPGLFECHHDHCVKEILKHVQLSNEGIHAIALVFNLTTRLGSFEIIIDDSWPFSSTFVLFTHAGVTENSDQEVIKLLLHPNCPNQFKRLMQKVNWRYMVLESIYPTGPSYHDSKSHELIEMIRKIFNDSQRALTVKDFNEVSLQKQLC